MNMTQTATLALLILCTAWTSPVLAKLDVNAKGWQVQSLKGISSVKYGVAYDPSNEFAKTVAASLSTAKVPMKSVHLKEDAMTPLSDNEARLKVVIDNRDKDQCWVGLSVEQKSKLARNSSITYDAETYKVGTVGPRAKANEFVKNVCEQFVQDYNAQAKSKGK